MTDETKKLFDAPWKAVNNGETTWDNSVQTSSGYMIACGCFSAESKRLAHLPELYDALVDLAYDHCYGCRVEATRREPPTLETFIEHGCQREAKQCEYNHWELLRKVRDGK